MGRAMKKLTWMCLILASIACSSEKPSRIQRQIENGVEVVLNHLEPYRLKNVPAHLIVEEEVSIDFERDDLGEIGISEILDFDVDSSGNIFCLCDSGIYKFDPDGNFLFKFSRKGQGPGELNYPTRCAVSERDEFWVFDYSKRRFIFFDREGKFLRETDLKVQGNMWGLSQVHYLDETADIQMSAPLDLEEANHVFRLIIQNSKSGELRALPEQLEDVNPSKNPRINLFNQELLFQIAQGKIYAYSQQNPQFEINVYDFKGTPLRQVRKQYQKVSLDEEFKTRRMEWFKNHPLSRVHKMQGYFPDFFPPIKKFYVDDRGRIFAETYEKTENTDLDVVDIFNPDGAYIICTTLAKSLSKRFHNDRLYALHEKDSGFQELIISFLRWE